MLNASNLSLHWRRLVLLCSRTRCTMSWVLVVFAFGAKEEQLTSGAYQEIIIEGTITTGTGTVFRPELESLGVLGLFRFSLFGLGIIKLLGNWL